MMGSFIGSIINLAITMTTPLALASVGEVYVERAGMINLGIEGIMLMGAFSGIHITYLTGNSVYGYLMGVLIGLVLGLLLAILMITFKVNQVIAGMGIYFLGFGLSDFLYETIYGHKYITIPKPSQISLPGLSNIPVIGPGLFIQYPSVYLSYMLIPLMWYLLYRSAVGISLRSVGENPRAADSMGVNVYLVKYLALITGSALAGLAGAALSLEITGLFFENMTFGLGFIAIGLVYFGKWDPIGAWEGSLIFGFTWSISVTLQEVVRSIGHPEMTYFMLVLPYIAIIIGLIAMSRRARAPKQLGIPYRRE